MVPRGDFLLNGAAGAGSDGPVKPCHDGARRAATFKRLPILPRAMGGGRGLFRGIVRNSMAAETQTRGGAEVARAG